MWNAHPLQRTQRMGHPRVDRGGVGVRSAGLARKPKVGQSGILGNIGLNMNNYVWLKRLTSTF